jgi:hypothetical protein
MQPLEATASDLRSKLAATDAKLRALTSEAADIDKALHALGKRETAKASVTIKQAILQLLGEAPNGLSSQELLTAMNDRFFDGALVRTSMSPQLARLKNDDHKIRQRGDKYFLA